jgi:NAD(P)-dependent dehydrogenase (short-subunit alcohol dehydrogenase family)
MAQSVIVTGGFGALGQVVAKAFADRGDKVARVDFAPSAPSPLPGALDIGGIDLTDAKATQAVLDQVVAVHGGIDVLINIAGGFTWETLEDGSLDSWARMQAMNVMTAATITKLALPHLKNSAQGRVINMGAGGAVKADMGMGAYAASKAGIHKLTEALAVELMGTSVTVNAILPSIIDTPTNRKDMPDADPKGWVTPQGIADVMLFLASPASGAVTGALIPATRNC